MPIIFLSPSMQPGNHCPGAGEEEHCMLQTADAMEPYLRASGIRRVRASPGAPLGQAIRESNAGYYDLHLALRSSVWTESLPGERTGVDIYYYFYSTRGKRAAEIISESYKKIYPDPDLVKVVSTNSNPEVVKTNAPAVLVKTTYRDDTQDVEWLKSSTEKIAAGLVESIAGYFGIPFISRPKITLRGTVDTEGGNLPVRTRPDGNSPIIKQAPNGAPIALLGVWNGWYVVDYQGDVGYADARYILL